VRHRRSPLLRLILVGLVLAAVLPAFAAAADAAAPTVTLVSDGVGARMSLAELAKTVIAMTPAQARSATIVVVEDGVTRKLSAGAYRTFALGAARDAAMENVRTAISSIEAYNADNYPGDANDPDAAASTKDSGYSGMTVVLLDSVYQTPLNLPRLHVTLARASRGTYCVQSTVYGQTAYKDGPAALVKLGHC
jgi:hypothetical protein